MTQGEPMSDKQIIEDQKKTIKVLQAENIRLHVELRKKKKKDPRVELIDKKIQ
jgi:ADP-dependent phosphofructokinase/glucokinase